MSTDLRFNIALAIALAIFLGYRRLKYGEWFWQEDFDDEEEE